MGTSIPAGSRPPKVHVILLSFNGWHHTVECLESLLRSSYTEYQVVIVDNASTDGSAEMIRRWAAGEMCLWVRPDCEMRAYSFPPVEKDVPLVAYSAAEAVRGGSPERERPLQRPMSSSNRYPIVLVQSAENVGFGKGNNIGMAYGLAKGDADLFWLLNNDTIVTPGSLAQMVEGVGAPPSITGSVVRDYAPPHRIQRCGGGFLSRATGRVKPHRELSAQPLDYIYGASMMVDRSARELVGGFDPEIHMYFEEIDYAIRARGVGVGLGFTGAVVYHKGGASSPDPGAPWRDVYTNSIRVMIRHFGLGSWVAVRLAVLGAQSVNPLIGHAQRAGARGGMQFLVRAIISKLKGT